MGLPPPTGWSPGRRAIRWYVSETTDVESPAPKLNIDYCSAALRGFQLSRPEIQGPQETEYGIGWAPTISYWVGERRIHLYDDYCSAPHAGKVSVYADPGSCPFVAELADLACPEVPDVKRCVVTRIEEIENLMERFLFGSAKIHPTRRIAGTSRRSSTRRRRLNRAFQECRGAATVVEVLVSLCPTTASFWGC